MKYTHEEKPGIVNWVYLGLAYIILSNIPPIAAWVYFVIYLMKSWIFPFPYRYFVLSGLSVIMIAASVTAFFGLIKMKFWTKMVTFIVISSNACLSIYLLFTQNVANTMIILVIDTLLLFLAYKVYTSEPLEIYLSSPRSDSK